MKVRVEIWESNEAATEFAQRHIWPPRDSDGLIAMYDMEHDDAKQRRVLGEQCRNAFEAGQCVVTYPIKG